MKYLSPEIVVLSFTTSILCYSFDKPASGSIEDVIEGELEQ